VEGAAFPEEYTVTRKHGTERPFTGATTTPRTPAPYECVCCGLPLFDSNTKFDYRAPAGPPSGNLISKGERGREAGPQLVQ
jgi:peptide methionine sulfoxide reductase MsrB